MRWLRSAPIWRELTLTVVMLSVGNSAYGQQAIVIDQDHNRSEVGQALLATYQGACFTVLPQHVLDEAPGAALLREGKLNRLGELYEVENLGDDIAVALVQGSIVDDCGRDVFTVRRNVGVLLQQRQLGVLRYINGDATSGTVSVTVIDDDADFWLRVQPTYSDTSIKKGMSGSLFLIEGVPVGMLLSVNSRTGVGNVLRIDALMRRVDEHVRSTNMPSISAVERVEDTSTLNGATEESVAPRFIVTRWSEPALGADSRATNLTSYDGKVWRVEPRDWPVTIELASSTGEIETISSVVFKAGTSVADEELPAMVEVLATVSAGPSQWRPIASERLFFRDGVASVEFAPLRARQLRFRFFDSAGKGNTLGLDSITPVIVSD